MDLKLKGHSNYKLSLFEMDGKTYVKKSAPDYPSFARLAWQAERQKQSENIFRFKSPKVHIVDPIKLCVVMDYIPHRTAISLINHRRNKVMPILRSELFDYYQSMSLKADLRYFEPIPFTDKLFQVEDKIIKTNTHIVVSRIRSAVKSTHDLAFSNDEKDVIIDCHGDFTLSNILIDYKKGDLYWFDFLDSFHHSLLIDYAKLLQEADYGWSGRFTVRHYSPKQKELYQNEVKDLVQGLSHIFSLQHRTLQLYSILNDLRLLQYEREPSWVSLITKNIELKVHEWI